jgi:UDP-glucuronate 4-epimerase
MAILLTGAAGFIGFHVAQALLQRGDEVIGLDNLNDYYDPRLKHARLEQLKGHSGFRFHQVDIAEPDAVQDAVAGADIRKVIHLAAQAGVRYSLTNPYAYIRANVLGHTVILELCRNLPNCEHLVYASSSSVYGGNTKLPFAVEDRVDSPISLYAATKKADELMSHAYAHLFGLPQTGLRFFTVYGPWGRPDMAMYIFTKAIFENRPIKVFNYGNMERDFTYVDDIVDGVIKTLDNPPPPDEHGRRYRLYNIGNNKSEPLLRMIDLIEQAVGRKAEKQLMPLQDGDVPATYADISAISRDVGFRPTTPIDVGIPRFVDWFRRYHNLIG